MVNIIPLQAAHGHACMCRHAPFLIPFQERAQVFTTVVGQDRLQQRESAMQSGPAWGRQFFVTIHRTSLLQVKFRVLRYWHIMLPL